MPYSLISDSLGRDPRWDALADGRPALTDALQAAYLRLLCETASHQHDGYLTEHQALTCCRRRRDVLALLCRPALGEKPFLHRPGDSCDERNCLDESGPWRDGFAYRICAYLKRNPSRTEHKRHQAKKADSRDAQLRAHVYERDGGCCRYCRSGPLKTRGMGRARDRRRVFVGDHPDPDQVATPPGRPYASNYVTACARCNEFKGERTPDEAGLTLLPVPTEEEKAAWRERGEALFDVPDNDNDNPADKRYDKQRSLVDDKPPSLVDDSCRDDETTGAVRPETPGQTQEQAAALSSEGSGSGRVGEPVVDPVASPGSQPQRGPDAPDVYHRRSRRGTR